MQSSSAIILSIRYQYVSKIFEGTKTVELRRIRPKHMTGGSLALIYAPSPVKSLVGAFRVDNVVELPLHELWESVGALAGISRAEFDEYFRGALKGSAIFFSDVRILRKPLTLNDLRNDSGFHPPQSFRYVTAGEFASPPLADLVGEVSF